MVRILCFPHFLKTFEHSIVLYNSIWKIKKKKKIPSKKQCHEYTCSVSFIYNSHSYEKDVIQKNVIRRFHLNKKFLLNQINTPFGIIFIMQENILLVCNRDNGKSFFFYVIKKLASMNLNYFIRIRMCFCIESF